MFTDEQPSYSTKILRRPPAKSSLFQIAVENDWDHVAEVVVGSSSALEPSPQLDQFVLLLESHGVLVHRLPCPQPKSQSAISHSPWPGDPPTSDFANNAQTPFADDIDTAWSASGPVPTPSHLSFFPRNAALVHGSRVIETPPFRQQQVEQSGVTACNNALFSLLEGAGAETVRWPVKSESEDEKGKAPEGVLVDAVDSAKDGDNEEDGPRFSPSDIIILSPTLLITRLSSCTNNKGLEYLWSVSSRSSDVTPDNDHDGSSQAAPSKSPPAPARPTTTLLVRITDPDSPRSATPTSPQPLRSPRASAFPPLSTIRKTPSSTAYIPLCRILVPIDERVMLYDPAFVAQGEARRLKSVLDRVQERGGDVSGQHNKRDSVMSYGTFGSLENSDEEGWQFISVDGLHATSILLVSPEVALLSPAVSSSPSPTTSSTCTNTDTLTKVSQVLESFGLRVVLPELGVGVRDAVLVLRRESFSSPSEDQNVAAGQDGWEQAGGEEHEEGCLASICAAAGAWLCGFLTSNASETDAESLSEHTYL